jgi:hypothetical protein
MSFYQNYKSGNKKFYNLFQALDHSKRTKNHVYYEFDKEFVKSISGHTKPTKNSTQLIKNLMVRGLRQMRQKYKHLRLALGGGTDSWTILKICVNNDIYLDEVVCGMVSFFGNVRADLEYLPAIKYARQYEGQQIGRIILMPPTKESIDFINDPEWFKNPDIGQLFPMRPFFSHLGRSLMNDPDSDFANITGLCKPIVLVKDGKPYWTQLDVKAIGEWMGVKNHCPLFYDKDNPELTVAMTYAFIDSLPDLKNDGVYDYDQITDRKVKDKILDSFGMRLEKPWLNYHFLGKKRFDLNIKMRYFFKELSQIGMDDYIKKWFDSMETIKQNYKDVPYAIEIEGRHVKPVGRFCQMLPISSEKFGHEDKSQYE